MSATARFQGSPKKPSSEGQPERKEDVKLVNMPNGFATFIGAIATFLAGLLVLGGAIMAWCSVQRQIRSAENIEKTRRSHEISAIEAGFTAELRLYSRTIIKETSTWNLRAQPYFTAGEAYTAKDLPSFSDPLYFKTNIGRIGMLRQPFTAGALTSFYTNLLEFNEWERSGLSSVDVTPQDIAGRLQTMAANLAQALDGLNDYRKFPMPSGIDVNILYTADGNIFATPGTPPVSYLQEALMRLAGPLEQ
jgi:hypothetical protein